MLSAAGEQLAKLPSPFVANPFSSSIRPTRPGLRMWPGGTAKSPRSWSVVVAGDRMLMFLVGADRRPRRSETALRALTSLWLAPTGQQHAWRSSGRPGSEVGADLAGALDPLSTAQPRRRNLGTRADGSRGSICTLS